MLRRLASHLTYANVMSTLAVFLVLIGGGFALASVGGTGRVKFGAQKGFDIVGDTVLNVKGVVKVWANCYLDSLDLELRNTSGDEMYLLEQQNTGSLTRSIRPAGGVWEWSDVDDFYQRLHFFRTSGADRPAADVVVTVVGGTGCGNDMIAAGAMSSEP